MSPTICVYAYEGIVVVCAHLICSEILLRSVTVVETLASKMKYQYDLLIYNIVHY